MAHATRLALLLAVLAGLTIPAGLTAPAHGQIYVDKDATGAGDGTSWADAYPDLQAAIDDAGASDELWIAEGIYTPEREDDSFVITGAIDGIELYGGFGGTETSRDQRAPEEHRTILSGDIAGDDIDPDRDGIIRQADPNRDGMPDHLVGTNARHVLVIDGGNGIGPDVSANVTSATVIDGVIVTAGWARGESPNDLGGGLYCDARGSGNECSPALQNMVFTGNAAGAGGAIYNLASEGTARPEVTNVVFSGNTARDTGGALLNFAELDGKGNPILINSAFVKNTAGRGGAMGNDARGRLVGPADSEASPIMTNVTFMGNTAEEDGGAIYSKTGGGVEANPTITNSILWGNSAGNAGSEMFNAGSLTPVSPTLTQTIVEGGVNGTGIAGDPNTDGGGNLDQDPQFVEGSNPAGADGIFRTADDGVNVARTSPALDAGTNAPFGPGGVAEDVTTDITGTDRRLDRDRDGVATVNIGAYEVPQTTSIAITGGGFGGLGRTFTAMPGEADQPIGVFRVTAEQADAALTGITVRLDASGAIGVRQLALWLSADKTFSATEDADLAAADLDPRAGLPAALTFDGFSEHLPAEPRYVFLTVTLRGEAEGTVTGYIANQTDLRLRFGEITKVNGNEQTGFSTLLLSAGDSPLPVEMAAFEGTRVDGSVRLSWTTTSEDNNAGFQVQRRTGGSSRSDGSRSDGSWSDVQFVEGAGTTSDPQTYRFTDRNVPYSANSLSYRLKQIDTGGTASLTDPITIARGGPAGLELLGTAPNPASRQVTVRYGIPETAASETRGPARLRLYDLLGREVRSVRLDGGGMAAGRHDTTLDVSGLPSGMYLLRLQAGGQAVTRKLTVVR
jgi:predicted outer membrane repeat protein